MSNIFDYYQSFLRATEQAAIEAAKLRGCEDGKLADKAATEAMRSVLNEEPIHTRVVIGEGERDDAPMLFIGEELGDKTSDIKIDIAVDPLECTNSCAYNLPDSISVLAAAPKDALMGAPDTYMNKLCGSKELIGHVSLENSVSENLFGAAKALGGFFEGKLHFYDSDFEKRAYEMLGENIHRVWSADDLCTSQNTFFVASGICTGWLPGVKFENSKATVSSRVIFGKTGESKLITNTYDIGEQ